MRLTIPVFLSSPHPIIFWAYVLPILLWTYLTATTHFVVVFDSEGFLQIAQSLLEKGWGDYFAHGPQREPLYPLVIAASLSLGKFLSLDYSYILKFFSFCMLLVTMTFIHLSLRAYHAPRWIQAIALCYTGMSPILLNSALCMYSEICALPCVAAMGFFGARFIETLRFPSNKTYGYGIALGLSCVLFTFVKGVGEALFPLFIGYCLWQGQTLARIPWNTFIRTHSRALLACLLIFFIPVLGFKTLNYIGNRHFNLTDRGTMALYGSIVHRGEIPATVSNILSHLSTVPISQDICSLFFPTSQCYQWSMSATDDTFIHFNEASGHLSATQRNNLITQHILEAILKNPLGQLIYPLQEGMKMFFWETIQGAFVIYPKWYDQLRSNAVISKAFALGVGLIYVIAFWGAWMRCRRDIMARTWLVLLSQLMLLFAFINIIHRYAILSAPLSIIITAIFVSSLLSHKNLSRD